MQRFALGVALWFGSFAGPAGAGDISSNALAKMGLASVQRLNARQGLLVRASPYPPGPNDGGTFQVYFAHFVQGQYNFLFVPGFQARPLAPILAPATGGGLVVLVGHGR
jgi:hypothetical protein